jgi:hypothetical protein
MLLVPFLVGTLVAGGSWGSLLLLLGWLLAYLVSYYTTQWLRARRKERFVAPLRLYLSLLVPVGLVLLVVEPWLSWGVVALLPFVVVNLHYARSGRPRAWQSGLASATAACLMAPLSYAFAGGADTATAVALFVVTWLYFAGSVLYVKTMIRERGDRRFLTASVAFHVFAVAAAARVDQWLALPFALYLLRAVVMPRRLLRPAAIGALEIVNSILLVTFTVALL